MIILGALEDLGYNVALVGEALRLTYHGEGTPDPVRVTPLLDALKIQKKEAVEYLKNQACFERMFKNAMREIDDRYQVGVIPYIKASHPCLWQQLVGAEDRLNEAWLAGKDDEFRAQLNEWTLLNFQAIKIFKGKNTQGHLFGEGGGA